MALSCYGGTPPLQRACGRGGGGGIEKADWFPCNEINRRPVQCLLCDPLLLRSFVRRKGGGGGIATEACVEACL